ncbi:16S rRNA (cytosine(967)-C(5))-methyltransferase RsmB [Pelistega europaea]|uniref:16S rRNA (Cytosine(967)-C(5))-methyltransferase RsmB n=1 Tax=Pelistega europaea TaxID=106147 RepID=A0A7Y4L854_9BURK|nr:16S rRNA (cytosine(967)-C(5))-methyltransferase RsmB [Pelistega europaea]NOL48755.1 16S rRNA (cytosine(967)-C(5))-methyltransferase RsmB [Pelistega europaea]
MSTVKPLKPTTPKSEMPKLSTVLFDAAQAVRQVLAGQSLTEVLDAISRERKAAVQAISFYSMRYLGTAQALSQLLLSKKVPNPLVQALLLVGLCLLTVKKRDEMACAIENPAEEELSQQHIPRYQDFTVVDETLKAAQMHKKSAPFKGLLNACLRRYLREQDSLWEKVQQQEEARFNYPQWWIDLIRRAYPQQWQEVLNAANTPGPLTLRVNRRRVTRDDFAAELTQAGLSHLLYGEDAIILKKAVPVQQIPGFDAGLCAVQDAGAQLAASILPLANGLHVLDACAAPGGKTAHVLERADVEMTALDIDAKRLARVQENLQNLGLYSDKVHLYTADASQSTWWDGRLFDIIMADVPCTASGIVRRHPDIKWLRKQSDVSKTAALQRLIVKNLWSLLKPGGYFLYITCSVFPQEGVEQAAFIEQSFSDAQRLAAPGQLLPIHPQGGVSLHDGFFYALFKKQEK